MKTVFRKFHCLWIVACLLACSDDKTPEEVINPQCSITVDGHGITQLEVSQKASVLTVFIEATTDWKMESDSEWCRVFYQSGKATNPGNPKEIEIRIDKSTQDESRTAYIQLVAESARAQLQVTQAGYMKVDETKWETASSAVRNMRVGWNLGNSLDVHGEWIEKYSEGKPSDYEKGWGNPITTPEMIRKFKEAGFNAIRVPVTWYPHLDNNDKIKEDWMQRVEEVVNYVLDADMYCILNVHHDTGTNAWLCADWDNYSAISARYKKLWEQIAGRFEKYEGHLLFESFNEMLNEKNQWTESHSNGYKATNALVQDFVDIVRESGGNNRFRNLIVNTYSAAHTPLTLTNFVVPEDIVRDRLIAQVHVYTPYAFALDKESPVTEFTAADEEEVARIMARLNERFCNKGIPVIIGEFSSEDKNNTPERVKHAACMVREAAQYGIVCIKWMGLLDRNTLEWKEPEILEAILQNAAQN